jgi:hypothetical protein
MASSHPGHGDQVVWWPVRTIELAVVYLFYFFLSPRERKKDMLYLHVQIDRSSDLFLFLSVFSLTQFGNGRDEEWVRMMCDRVDDIEGSLHELRRRGGGRRSKRGLSVEES